MLDYGMNILHIGLVSSFQRSIIAYKSITTDYMFFGMMIMVKSFLVEIPSILNEETEIRTYNAV
jgi:hypothetical protein